MFSNKVAVILGAGASCEFGLPAGYSLARSIAKACAYDRESDGIAANGDHALFKSLMRGIPSSQKAGYLNAADRINKGIIFRASIDDFIDLHEGNELIERYAKAAIVREILRAEKQSALHFDFSNIFNNIDFEIIADTWIIKLMHMINARTLAETEIAFKDVVFVVFNYDRCLEHFLVSALRAVYHAPYERAFEVASSVKIFHPYGMAGRLPSSFLGGGGVPFGGGPEGVDDWPAIGESIQTYSENRADKETLLDMQSELDTCETMIFLGFGFHKQNLNLLKRVGGYNVTKLFASAYGFVDNDLQIVSNRLAELFNRDNRWLTTPMNTGRGTAGGLFVQPVKCADLFDRYRLTMVER